jgi:Endoplasmic Reticulum-Golgi Intermediate Compartment (ERGIC)
MQSPGGGRRRQWAAGVDMYRRIPADLTEGTRSGSFFSYCAVMVMLMLFMLETRDYMQKR